jgi:hypothetical protein
MGLNHPKSGLNYVSEFQVSGYPWLTGSVFPTGKYWVEVPFPRITKNFTIINLDAGFIHPSGSTSGGKELVVFFGDVNTPDTVQPSQILHNHYVTLPDSKNAFVFDVRCKKVYVGCHDTGSVGGFQVIAELSGISSSEMPILTGSGIDETF